MNYLIAVMLVAAYEWGRVTLGLVVHPYRTMRGVVRNGWTVPVMGIPLGMLAVILVATRIGAGMVDVPGVWRTEVALGLMVAAIGLGLWQLEIGYLWWRFREKE